MIDYFEHTYSIKRFTKVTDDFVSALKIYNDTTPYEIKTDTNEITYWLTNDNSYFEIYAFGLYLDKKLIGFSMTAYLPNIKAVVDDYLAIAEPYIVNTLFLNYMGLIQNYYTENNFDIAFYITEISNKYNGEGLNKESKLSLKLLCLEEYAKINALYIEPSLGFDNAESEFEAYIYLKNIDNITKIKKETYLKIVYSLYMDYYYRWYLPFLKSIQNESDLYRKNLIKLYEIVEKALDNEETVNLIKNDCDILKNIILHSDSTAGYIPIDKKSNKLLIIFTITAFVLGIPCISVFWIKLLIRFGVSVDIASSFFSAVIPAIITGIAAYLVAIKEK